ncbi:MAG: hypothetical protein VXZ73_01985, partial [Pseudomonadota bacterium]|nr:hypothetical protein [Pseudomonadota bacterium]MEC8383198.1 hypothetical protein [Pseudomonadota bacterium]
MHSKKQTKVVGLTGERSDSSSSTPVEVVDLSGTGEDNFTRIYPAYKKVDKDTLLNCLGTLALALKSGIYQLEKPTCENDDFLIFNLSQMLYPRVIRPFKEHGKRTQEYCRIELRNGQLRQDMPAVNRGASKDTLFTKKTSVTLSTTNAARMPVFHQHYQNSIILGFDFNKLKLKRDALGVERYVWERNATSNARSWYVKKTNTILSEKSIPLNTLTCTTLSITLDQLRYKLHNYWVWASHNEILACLQKDAVVGVLYRPEKTTLWRAMCAKLEILHGLGIDVPVAKIDPTSDITGLTIMSDKQILTDIQAQLTITQPPAVYLEWATLVHLQLYASEKYLDHNNFPAQIDFDKAVIALRLYQNPALNLDVANTLRYVNVPFSKENTTNIQTKLNNVWEKWLSFLPHKIRDGLNKLTSGNQVFNIVDNGWACEIISDFLGCLPNTCSINSVSECKYWAMQMYLMHVHKVNPGTIEFSIDQDIIDLLSGYPNDKQRCDALVASLNRYYTSTVRAQKESNHDTKRIQGILEYACLKLSGCVDKRQIYNFYLGLLTREGREGVFGEIKSEYLQELRCVEIYSNEIAWKKVYRNNFGRERVLADVVISQNHKTIEVLLEILSFLSQNTTHCFGSATHMFFERISHPDEKSTHQASQKSIDYKLKLVAETGCLDLVTNVISSIATIPCSEVDQERIEQCMQLACLIIDIHSVNTRQMDYIKLLNFVYAKGWMDLQAARGFLGRLMAMQYLEKIDYHLLAHCFESNLCVKDDLLQLMQTGKAVFLHNLITTLLKSLSLVSAENASVYASSEQKDLVEKFIELQQATQTADDRTIGNRLLAEDKELFVRMLKFGLILDAKRKEMVSNIIGNIDHLAKELGADKKPIHWNSRQMITSRYDKVTHTKHEKNLKRIHAAAIRVQVKFGTQYAPFNLEHAQREQLLLRLPTDILKIMYANTARACRKKQQLEDIAKNYASMYPHAKEMLGPGRDLALEQLLEQRSSLRFLLEADKSPVFDLWENWHAKWKEQEEAKRQCIENIIKLLKYDSAHETDLFVLPCILAGIEDTSAERDTITIDLQCLNGQLSRLSHEACKKIYMLYKLQNKMKLY